ncbi:hypothetical protein CQW23_17950 [Capsicum baccatum]|uniref:EF-hand domain-containing protein n=1 Tax=Capsicum baccatum TaxID=33114 RepID=A0A2G2WFA4_CAPBA|nr:hypothetical protein CQW23_17950 [Capsicum baccatum]
MRRRIFQAYEVITHSLVSGVGLSNKLLVQPSGKGLNCRSQYLTCTALCVMIKNSGAAMGWRYVGLHQEKELEDDSIVDSWSYFVGSDLPHLERRTEIDDGELARFVEHVDMDNNGIITFEEWRNFLLLYPHEATLENIYR